MKRTTANVKRADSVPNSDLNNLGVARTNTGLIVSKDNGEFIAKSSDFLTKSDNEELIVIHNEHMLEVNGNAGIIFFLLVIIFILSVLVFNLHYYR